MKNKRSPSSLSTAMHSALLMNRKNHTLIKKKLPSDYTIKIANTLEERECVFRLAYQVYLAKGFIKENANEWLVQSYDQNSETIILLIKDRLNNIVGSVTLVFDGSCILPAEKIYSEELNLLRKQNEKIVEISRLVIDPHYRNSKEVLVLLFNYLYIYSYFVKKYSSLVIEVNPRHVNYYQALLHFRPIGNEKPCPNVQNAPAVLMHLALEHSFNETRKIWENRDSENVDRSLYHYFLTADEQDLVVHSLKSQVRKISAEEKQYFGFSNSGFMRSLCI